MQAETLVVLGDAEGARFPLAEVLDAAEELGSSSLTAQAIRTQARMLEARGERGAAEARFSRALEIFSELGDIEAVEGMTQALQRVSSVPSPPSP